MNTITTKDGTQIYYKDIAAGPFFGANRPGAKVSQGISDSFWLQGMQAGAKNMKTVKSLLKVERSFRRKSQEGKIGWALLWLMGVPVPVLMILFLLRGCD